MSKIYLISNYAIRISHKIIESNKIYVRVSLEESFDNKRVNIRSYIKVFNQYLNDMGLKSLKYSYEYKKCALHIDCILV